MRVAPPTEPAHAEVVAGAARESDRGVDVVAMSRAAELSGRRHRTGRWYATLATIGTGAAAAFLGGPPEQAAGAAAVAPVDWGPGTTVARPRSSADFPFPPGQHMDVAVGPRGQGVVVFCDASKRLRAARMTRSGRWNTPRTVGPCNGQPAPSVVMDYSGRATTAWISGLEVWSAIQPAGGPWSRAAGAFAADPGSVGGRHRGGVRC
jgi:hypothetical protein